MRGHVLKGLANAPDEKPHVSWSLLKRVFRYAVPYKWSLIWMLVLLLASTGLSLVSPMVVRQLIDKTIPTKDIPSLIWLAACLFLIPLVNGIMSVVQRRLTVGVGEGVIFDLRVALYSGLQRMSLRFFHQHQGGRIDEPLEQ